MLRRALLYIFCVLFLSGIAQTKKRNFRQSEIGFFAGGSYYIGDLNQRRHFVSSQPAGGIYFRYTTNYRFSFRFGFNAGALRADDAESGEPDQMERNLNFQTKLYDFHSIAEFNFVEYRIGHDRYKFCMFIFAGLAGFNFNPQSATGENLRDLHTEGQSSTYPKYQFAIPFGVGLKWNMGEKCGMGIEWGPRNTFTDYIDDVKGNYPAAQTAGENGSSSSLEGSMRGNPSTKDWYFFYGVTFTVKLPGRRQCHNIF